MNHELYNLVLKLGISTKDSLSLFSNGVRDQEDINAYKCSISGIIILDNINSGKERTYIQKQGMDYFKKNLEGNQPKNLTNKDDEIRAEAYKELIRGKTWLDVGCGQGGPSLILKDFAICAETVKLQEAPRDYLNSKGVKCFGSLNEVENSKYDLITMFHVFEHLEDPISFLEICYKKLKPGGKLVIEVPHANDILLSTYHSDAFKKFTLWSEHLILHTKYSLSQFVIESGFKIDSIKSVQRYPLSNHLFWLAKNKPGGHNEWSFLNSHELEQAYSNVLASNDKTDTIVAYCVKSSTND
jgi:2-polyprenyl-3-methyl-5-hydroxy-6-metoxy-1,4-benzoquinol methylase